MGGMTEQTIREFWNAHPCGEGLVGGFAEDYEAFFRRYDAFRYGIEGHILSRLDAIDFQGKRVLEVGLGQGADAEQIIRRGAIWSGLDFSAESVNRVAARLKLRGLSHEKLACGSALSMPFEDNSFDIVYAHGVLHHIPNILGAQDEIARVLKPSGLLVAMLYARRSINYLFSISILRRMSLAALYLAGVKGSGIVAGHLENARNMGLRKYLQMTEFIHANTDGPSNPYSKVYDLATVDRDFPAFRRVKSYQDYMHAPPLPVSWLWPLAGVLGWHLWVHSISLKK
jgi:ubiquinone/menaquinone biosynthesis C-methylase UbiE